MILEKLKVMKDYTKQEKHLVDYILAHPETILSLSSDDLSKKSHVSKSTITRFCQKLGLKGYREFQLRFTNEHYREQQHQEISTSSLRSSKDLQDSIRFTSDLYMNMILDSKSLIQYQNLARVINYMKIATYIDFYGAGINYYQALYFSEKFRAIGFESNAYSYHNQFVLGDLQKNKKTLAFLISQSGNNPSMIECAHYLKKQGIKTVSVSGLRSQQLEILCDEHLSLISKFNDIQIMNSSRHLSIMFLLDILFNHFYTLRLNQQK